MAVTQKSILDAARELIEANIQAEPAIIKAYLFPSDDEIRLIYIDPMTSPTYPDERVAPYYFSPGKNDPPYVSAIALVLPAEAENVLLPEGWGNWDEAEIIYPRTDGKSNQTQSTLGSKAETSSCRSLIRSPNLIYAYNHQGWRRC